MPVRRATLLVLVAALLAALVLELTQRRSAGGAGAARTPSAALLAQVRANTVAGVAERIYFQEVYGTPNSAAVREITAQPGLTAGLESGDLTLARRTLNHLVVRHAVRERVARGARTLVDVGLKFVIAGQRHPLYAPDGAYLGRIEISIQDVIGFIKLCHRLTGAEIVVRGRPGHAKSSLAAAMQGPLPRSGPLSLGGRSYFVSSFMRVGFGGEPLTVWIVNPSG